MQRIRDFLVIVGYRSVLFTFTFTVTFTATEHYDLLTSTKLHCCFVTKSTCELFAQRCYMIMKCPGVKPATKRRLETGVTHHEIICSW